MRCGKQYINLPNKKRYIIYRMSATAYTKASFPTILTATPTRPSILPTPPSNRVKSYAEALAGEVKTYVNTELGKIQTSVNSAVNAINHADSGNSALYSSLSSVKTKVESGTHGNLALNGRLTTLEGQGLDGRISSIESDYLTASSLNGYARENDGGVIVREDGTDDVVRESQITDVVRTADILDVVRETPNFSVVLEEDGVDGNRVVRASEIADLVDTGTLQQQIDALNLEGGAIADVNSRIDDLIGLAPPELDTLKEIADAIGNLGTEASDNIVSLIATERQRINDAVSAINTLWETTYGTPP